MRAASGAFEDVPDEEGPHLGDELARLAGLAHRLDEVGERVQGRADEADDELVVRGVEAVAREADVVAQLGVEKATSCLGTRTFTRLGDTNCYEVSFR